MERYNKLTVRELKPILKDMGLLRTGRKAILLGRIEEFLAEEKAREDNGEAQDDARTPSPVKTRRSKRNRVLSPPLMSPITPQPSSATQQANISPGDESPSLFLPHTIAGRPLLTIPNEALEVEFSASIVLKRAVDTENDSSRIIAGHKSAIEKVEAQIMKLQQKIAKRKEAIKDERVVYKDARRVGEKKKLAFEQARMEVQRARELAMQGL